MTAITIYTKPTGCSGCTATKRTLDSKGIDYCEIDLSTIDDATLDEFRARGLAQAPIVVTETETWSGFRPDKLITLG